MNFLMAVWLPWRLIIQMAALLPWGLIIQGCLVAMEINHQRTHVWLTVPVLLVYQPSPLSEKAN